MISFLKEQGIQGGYASYWHCYPLTFLSGEAILIAPFQDWDRFPSYTRRVHQMQNPAYIFNHHEVRRDIFVKHLKKNMRPFEATKIGQFVIYTSPKGTNLMPEPIPLKKPVGEIAILSAPEEAIAGTLLEIPIRIQNHSDAFWSASGIGDGAYRVAVSYRWFDLNGRAVVIEGIRTLLPRDLDPGESLEMMATVLTPTACGKHDLQLTFVQEDVAWFDQATGSHVRKSINLEPPPDQPT